MLFLYSLYHEIYLYLSLLLHTWYINFSWTLYGTLFLGEKNTQGQNRLFMEKEYQGHTLIKKEFLNIDSSLKTTPFDECVPKKNDCF